MNLSDMMQGNPMASMMMQMMQGGSDPTKMISTMMSGNPKLQQAYTRAQQMSQGKSKEQLEETLKNVCQQSGMNYEESYKQFMQMLGK